MQAIKDKDFKTKIIETLEKVPFVEDVVALYFCLKDPETPLWIKAQIIGTIVYFISPLDTIPDTIFGVGYTDDAAVVFALIKSIEYYLDERHYEQAKNFINELKGGTV